MIFPRKQITFNCPEFYQKNRTSFQYHTSKTIKDNGEFIMEEFKVKGKELLAKIEELIKEGNARRIIIKDEKGRTFLEIPVTIGVIGAICAPILNAVGALAGVVANFTVEVIKRENNNQNTEAPREEYNL